MQTITTQTEILEALAPHIKAEYIEASEFDNSVWVQIKEKWALVEPVDSGRKGLHSFKITTGYEAGTVHPEQPTQLHRVNGLKFGLVPKVLQWVDKNGQHRPAK